MKAPVVLVLAMAVTASCGGDDKGSDQSDSLTLAASPATLTIAQSGQGTVALTLTRTGHVTGAVVALAVTGLPDGVTATFDSASTTADTATLTVSASASAAQATTTLTVTAIADSIDASAAIAVTVGPPAPFDVHGKVSDKELRNGAGTTVTLWSADGSAAKQTTTANDGTFVITGVLAPYDVELQNGYVTALILGSTSATPAYAVDLPGSADITTKVTPTVSGTTGHSAGIAVACPSTSCGSDDNGGYTYQCRYPTAVTAPETCHASALQYDISATSPYPVTAFTGFGKADVTITPHANNTFNVPLSGPLATRPWSFLLSAYLPAEAYGHFYEPGYSEAYWDIAWQAGGGIASGAHAFILPNDERVHVAMRFTVLSGNNYTSRVVDVNSVNPVVVLPAPNIVITPEPDAHVTAGSSFVSTPREGAVFTWELAYGGPLFTLISSDSLVSFDVFAEHGITVPTGPWQLNASSVEPATVDSAFLLNVTPGLILAPASTLLTVD